MKIVQIFYKKYLQKVKYWYTWKILKALVWTSTRLFF